MTIEVELPDGTVVEFPDGTPDDVMSKALKAFMQTAPDATAGKSKTDITRQRVAERAAAQNPDDRAARQAEIDRAAEDQIILSRTPGVVNAAGKFVQGLPFIGEYADEMVGAIGGDRAMQGAREQQDAMGRAYPVASTALQIAGGVTGAIPMAAAAGPSVMAAAPAALGGKVAAGIGAGALAGGIEGAVSGYGAGTEGTRGQTAVQRGTTGAVFGGLLGGAAPVLGAGIKSALEWVKGRDVSVIAKTLNIGKDAARYIKTQVEADDFAKAADALKRSGGDAMLADAGPGFAQMLDTAMQSSPAAARVGRDAVETRSAAVGKKLNATFDAILGKAAGVRDASRSIAQRTAATRKAAYDAAYGSAIDYADHTGRAIEDVIARVPPKTLSAAVSEANDAMRAAGVKNMQIMAEIADDGSVSFSTMPNVQQLDELKKALGAIAEKETDAVTGKISGAGLRAKRLASDLKDAIVDAVPRYAKAVKMGGDKIAEDNALNIGRKLLSPATTREMVKDTFASPSIEAQDAARRGLREYIDETLANVRSVISDPNTDAREAMRAVKDMSSKAAREKVEIVLGKAKANRLFAALDEASAQLELRGAVARNSATAARTEGNRVMNDIVTPPDVGALANIANLKPGTAAKQVIDIFTGNSEAARQARKSGAYQEVAKALTAKRGPDAAAALQAVQKAIEGQPVSSKEAAMIARVLTTGGALTAYQTGTRSLAIPQGAQR